MPHWGATAGEDLFAIYFAPSTTSLEFTTPTGEYIVLKSEWAAIAG